jgi:hypothetical protein
MSRERCGISGEHGVCWLPPDHRGEHESERTGRKWPRVNNVQARGEGWVPWDQVSAIVEERDRLRLLFEVLSGRLPWQPLKRGEVNHEQLVIAETIDEVWKNDEYEVKVMYLGDRGRAGPMHLSIKRWDKTPAHDWRDLQAIKNEICGWGREGFELFPAEARLVDQADQTHIWVTAAGQAISVGFPEGLMLNDEERRRRLKELGLDDSKGSQRDWRPGISTGPNYRPETR